MLTEARSLQQALDAVAGRRIAEAIELLYSAERHGADPAECAATRWRCWMLLGDFENAWRESNRIDALRGPAPDRFWDGRSFRNRRVVIRCLHGFGDALQFIRYAPLVRAEAAQVLVQTHPELVGLTRTVPGVNIVYSWAEEGRYGWDQQIEVMELPRAFRTTLETIPADVPYLSARRIPSPKHGQFRVGLQWGSSTWDPRRSILLQALEPLVHLPGIEFFSLQRAPQDAELDCVSFRDRIDGASGSASDIAEAAAELFRLDLLITVDTMLAHLAGALAIPTWVLLPWEADWRWMLNRTDSPWYPTMRLYRQPSPGSWAEVVRYIASDLATASKLSI